MGYSNTNQLEGIRPVNLIAACIIIPSAGYCGCAYFLKHQIFALHGTGLTHENPGINTFRATSYRLDSFPHHNVSNVLDSLIKTFYDDFAG
jgi:hypothetical protein